MVTRGCGGWKTNFPPRIVSTERPFRKAVLGRRTTLARVTFEGEHGFLLASTFHPASVPTGLLFLSLFLCVCYSPWERSRYRLDFRGNSPRFSNSFLSSWNAIIIYREFLARFLGTRLKQSWIRREFSQQFH